MTFEELEEEYGFKETLKEVIERNKKDMVLNPVYAKHLPACWIIEDIYGHLMNERITSGKARELTAAVIEKHLQGLMSIPTTDHEEILDQSAVAFSIAGFKFERKDLDMIVSMQELVYDLGGSLDLKTITRVMHEVNERHRPTEID